MMQSLDIADCWLRNEYSVRLLLRSWNKW